MPAPPPTPLPLIWSAKSLQQAAGAPSQSNPARLQGPPQKGRVTPWAAPVHAKKRQRRCLLQWPGVRPGFPVPASQSGRSLAAAFLSQGQRLVAAPLR